MKKENILIIGGTKGIGKAIAESAINIFDNVFVIARNQPLQINTSIHFIKQDFNDLNEIEPTLKHIQPDITIFCVAKGIYGKLEQIENKQIETCLFTTFNSTLFWLKESIKYLKPNSRIGYLASLTSKIPNSDWAFYSAAKAGVVHFIDCIRDYTNQKGISITTCFPGIVATDFHKESETFTPDIAIKPSEIADSLLNAVLNRDKYWSAPMDKEFIDILNYQYTNLVEHYKEILK